MSLALNVPASVLRRDLHDLFRLCWPDVPLPLAPSFGFTSSKSSITILTECAQDRRDVDAVLFGYDGRTGAAVARLRVGGQGRILANIGSVVMQIGYAIGPVAGATREAEGVRFELTRPFGPPVFKTGAINRSATPPQASRPIVAALYEHRKPWQKLPKAIRLRPRLRPDKSPFR